MSTGAPSLLDQIKELKSFANMKRSPDVRLATAIVLLEVANSDQVVDRLERNVIQNGLKHLFDISTEEASACFAEAQSHLRNMRSSATEAALLKDHLDAPTKRAVMQLIERLIHLDGAISGMEVYLRNRFRSLLGIAED